MAKAYLAEHRELVADARATVERWTLEGVFGKRAQRAFANIRTNAAPARLNRNCHSPSMNLPSCCKIVLAYSVFQNGCLEASRQKKNHLKIGSAQQQRKRLNKKKFGGKFASEKVLNRALPSPQSMHSADSSGHGAPGNARRKVIQRDAARAKGFFADLHEARHLKSKFPAMSRGALQQFERKAWNRLIDYLIKLPPLPSDD
jgi:hypothetical protein